MSNIFENQYPYSKVVPISCGPGRSVQLTLCGDDVARLVEAIRPASRAGDHFASYLWEALIRHGALSRHTAERPELPHA